MEFFLLIEIILFIYLCAEKESYDIVHPDKLCDDDYFHKLYGILLWRRIRKYYTSTRVSQRRRFGSVYWSRRKIYWRQRDISRTGYIVEALHGSIKQGIYSKSESQERKEEILTKP